MQTEFGRRDDFAPYNDQAFIDGRLLALGRDGARPIIDPATEAVIGSTGQTPPSMIEDAVRIANRAQLSWVATSVDERARVLHAVASAIRDNAESIARLITLEMGKPLKESLEELAATAPVFDYFAELARHDQGRVIGPSVSAQLHFVTMQAMGVSVHIVPYNYPIQLLAWGVAASLAAGNATVIKPSEFTTASTLRFAEILRALPTGLLQVLPGGAEVGQRLVSHPDTHVVAFTGSVAAGKAVAAACAAQFKRCTIEASGSDPFIVMPSAELSSAIEAATLAAFANCGQVCTAAERFYVHESVFDGFVGGLVEMLSTLSIGAGIDGTHLGPLVSAAARERHERLIQEAVSQGARLAYGGKRPAGLTRGWFVEPTVLVDCQPHMDLFTEEAFSPLAPIVKVRSFDEAICLANASSFGLGATVFTEDINEALAASEQLQCGIVSVNAAATDNPAAPFGGRKLSGTGAQLGPQGLDAFRVAKQTMITRRMNGGRS
ncbi:MULTISPECIES: aldehyde dehydrogenase family protein [unclassified Caballeronia]|uniref:aldehyde dehydrogenase family protein n=1 Tax=unclassified Caballeronia TaxID=2646786 RepID=UPI002028E98C|nr:MULTISPECIES: aldehyde dehydrogenase family protein [unclassified Caballeronia]